MDTYCPCAYWLKTFVAYFRTQARLTYCERLKKYRFHKLHSLDRKRNFQIILQQFFMAISFFMMTARLHQRSLIGESESQIYTDTNSFPYVKTHEIVLLAISFLRQVLEQQLSRQSNCCHDSTMPAAMVVRKGNEVAYQK